MLALHSMRPRALAPQMALACLALLLTILPATPSIACGAAASPAPGEIFRQGISAYVRGDHDAARQAFETDCAAGSVSGCVQLALMLADGEGGPAEPERARAMMSSACFDERLGAGACHRLGAMLLNGEGGPVDLPGARTALYAACLADDPQGCYDDAAMLIRGQGGAHEAVDALAPLQKACDFDHPAGCYAMGVVMRDSYGSLRATEIAEAFQRACDLGDTRGCDAPVRSE